MDKAKAKELALHATNIRMGVIEAVHAASSGHPGGSLSIAEILSYLYFEEMNIDPKNPKWEDRDRLVLSKGHCAPGLYSALAEAILKRKSLRPSVTSTAVFRVTPI